MTIGQEVRCGLIVVNLLAIVIFSAVTYVKRKQSLLSDLDSKLTVVATMAREALPRDYHDTITGPGSVSGSEFDKIVDRNNRLCRELGLEYIWSLLVIDGQIVFTTATSPDKTVANHKHAGFFEPHSNPELYTNTFATMRATYKSNHDKWGDIRVALIPSLDSQGRKYLFGASVRLTDVDQQLDALFRQSLFIGLVLFVFSLLIGVWVSRVVTSPIQRLTETIRLIADGRGDLEAEERGTVEQITLAQYFNQMNRALQDKIIDLESARQRLIGRHTAELKLVEGSLQMSEQRFKALLDFAVDGILIGSHDGIITESNKRMCELFGLSREEIVGKHVTEMPFTAESLVKTPFRFDLVQKGEMVVTERTIRRPDGSELVVEMHSKMMPDDTYQSIYHDISARKQAEDEIRLGQARLARQYEMVETLLQNLTVGVFMVEVPSGKPLVANQAALQLLGRGALPDANAQNLGDIYGAYKAADLLTRYPVNDMPITLGMKGISGHVDDLVVIRPDGTKAMLEIFGSPVKDAQGRVWASLVSFSDITERKRIEQALKDSENRYRQLFEMESDAILLIDNETGRILDANLAAQKLYGYDRDELLVMRNVDLSAEEEQTQLVTQQALVERPAFLRIALRKHQKRDGTIFPVEITASCFFIDERSVHIAAVRDITERRKAQELLESWNASLERRVAERTAEVEKYTHQLQALTGRLVRAEEDERQRITDVLHEDLQQILVAIRMTLGVVLANAKVAAVKQVLETTDGMLAQSIRLTRSLVQDIAVPAVREGEIPFAVDWLRQQMEEKFSLAVDLVIEEGVKPVSENVYLCLYRAIQELLFNVVKHAQVNRVEVTIRNLDGGGYVQVVVRDRGRGFSPQALDHSEKANKGFGLFSIRERLEGLGGRMEINAEVGKGTAVVLTVPLRG